MGERRLASRPASAPSSRSGVCRVARHMLLEGSALPLWTLTGRRRALCAQGRAVVAGGVLGGLLSVLGYGLVLWAQTQGPLGPIAALRETSIIVGALIGAVVFHERFGRPRTVAAVVVAAGILVLTLG